MKKTLSFLMSALVAVFFASCEKTNEQPGGPDDPDDPDVPETGFVLTTPDAFDAEWRADTLVIEYTIENPTATGIVSASTDADWMTFNTQTYGMIYVYVAENMSFEERTAEVLVKYESVEYKVTVKQTSREWDQEVICPYAQGYYYGDQNNPGSGVHSAQIYISDTGWGDTGYTQDPKGHYFQIELYFPEQPEGTDYAPEGTYELKIDDMSAWTMRQFGSSYFPGQMATERKLFTEGKCVITKDGDNFVIDLDVVTEKDGLSRHARYTGPIALRIL